MITPFSAPGRRRSLGHLEVRMPWARSFAGPKTPRKGRSKAARAVATPDGSEEGAAPPYYRTFQGYFEDMGQPQSGMSSPEGQAASAGIPNFAAGGAAISIS